MSKKESKKKEGKKKEGKKKADVRRRKSFSDYKVLVPVMMAIVGFIIVVIAIINFNQRENIDSSYFHDADGKIVLTMDRDMAALDDSEYEPFLTHVVYYYDGEKVTNVRAFYEYSTEAEAEMANRNLEVGEFADNKKLNGRFVIFQVKKSQYKDLTVEELKQSIESLKEIDALILDYGDGYIDRYGILYIDES